MSGSSKSDDVSDVSDAALVARSLSELRDALTEASLALKEYQFKHDPTLRCKVDSEAGELISRATQSSPGSKT